MVTVVWLTGLSGAGKSTVARALSDQLVAEGRAVAVLDGDELRRTLSSDLGYSKEDRDEQVRRVTARALEEGRAGRIAVVALISPYRAARDQARAAVTAEGCFIEVHLDCALEELRRRDPKGLYRRADAGLIDRFTGISDPYEAPLHPDARIDTATVTVDDAVDMVLAAIAMSCGADPGNPIG